MATKPRTKRITKPVYEPVIKLPPLRYEDFVALRDNIAVNGVLVPILVDSDGPKRKIIDGNYRKQIANELGYDCPEIVHDTDTGGFLRMWQLGLDQEVGQWKPSTGTHLTAAAISPDGNLLATGDYHGDVKLWRMKELFGG